LRIFEYARVLVLVPAGSRKCGRFPLASGSGYTLIYLPRRDAFRTGIKRGPVYAPVLNAGISSPGENTVKTPVVLRMSELYL